MPLLEEYDYDAEAHAEAVAAYVKRKADADAEKAEAEARNKRMNDEFQAKQAAYEVNKGKLAAPDFDEAENAVKATFTPTAQGVVLSAAKEPEKVVYAIGKSPALAKALADLQHDPIAMAAEIGRIEGRITGKPRKPRTKPEAVPRGGASTGQSADSRHFAADLENPTGDLTAAYKRLRKKVA